MAFTLEVVGKGFRLKGADNKREIDVSPAQAKAWQEILDRRAREQRGGRAELAAESDRLPAE